MRTGYVPTDLLRPVIRNYLDAYEANQPLRQTGRTGTPQAAGAREVLCVEAGVKPRLLYRILSGESKHTRFDTADRLLCAMNLVWMWHVPPLADVYQSVDLAGIPEREAA
jgi:hypothetical protein